MATSTKKVTLSINTFMSRNGRGGVEKYIVVNTTNTLTPKVGSVIDENEVKSLMRRRDMNVLIQES